MKTKGLFDNSTVRRQDRLLEYDRAMELLINAEYGVLSLGGKAGYGIPLNFVLNEESLYFHCAPEGKKLQLMKQNNEVCFCIIGNTKPFPEKFTTAYESVLVFGKISLVDESNERMHALELIVAKYSPDFKDLGRKYAEKSFHRTAVLRLDINQISGKTKIIPSP